MTALAPAPSSQATQPAEAARARVAVLVATHQVDVVLPTRFGIESFMDDLLAVLAAAIDDESVDFTPVNGQWSLARPGEAAIPRWRTLADHDISDGALLMLTVVESSEVFSPLVEDITDALALINDREFGEFDADAAAFAGLAAFGALACSIAALLAWSWTDTASVLWCALPALLLGGGCWTAAVLLGRRGLPKVTLAVALSALPLLFAGAAMLVPPSYGHPGPFAAANIAAGAAVAAIVAGGLLGPARGGRPVLMAVTVLGLLTAASAGAMTVADLQGRQIAGAMALAGLILLTTAPRIAVLLARIRPPDLPDPGREVMASTLNDIFDAASSGEPAEDEPQPGSPRGIGGIEARARLAVTGLRGLVAAAVLVLSAATVWAAASGPGGVREIVLAVAVAGALVLRARWHPDRVQAWLLIGGGVIAALGVGVVLVGAYADPVARLVVVAVLAAGALAGVFAGLRLPGVRLSPIVRRIIDLVEYLLILVIPLLACWIMGIYTALRGL